MVEKHQQFLAVLVCENMSMWWHTRLYWHRHQAAVPRLHGSNRQNTTSFSQNPWCDFFRQSDVWKPTLHSVHFSPSTTLGFLQEARNWNINSQFMNGWIGWKTFNAGKSVYVDIVLPPPSLIVWSPWGFNCCHHLSSSILWRSALQSSFHILLMLVVGWVGQRLILFFCFDSSYFPSQIQRNIV